MNDRSLTVEKRDDGVAIVFMDVAGEPVNTLRGDFAGEFEQVFGELERDGSVRAIVFASKKKDGFIAGADIGMLREAKTKEAATELSHRGQQAMDRLERLGKPVVAAIHGACLGGGLETALACHGRVASDHPKTKLGVPEVQLGLLPGAGGTLRLPQRIGVQQALDLMLTGKQLPAKRALKAGLVDEVVPPAILIDVAAKRALDLASLKKPKSSPLKRMKDMLGKDELRELALEGNAVGRRVLFTEAKKKLFEKTRGNYPATERILEVVRTGLEKGRKAGLEAERKAFGELAMSPEASQLMNIFFATTALKKDRGVDGDVTPRDVKKVAMIGAGLMGAGISFVTASNGNIPVRLKDQSDEGVLKGLSHVRGEIDQLVKRKRLAPFEAERTAALVSGTTDYSGFRDVDVVIEAVFEDIALKHRIVEEVEAVCPPTTVFASNTSSLPITKIAEASRRPETVLGMHYFSPVEKMPLLEVIATKQTAPWAIATAVALGKKQGKTVIVVNDGVGFYTSRILGPFMSEAAHLLAEGVAIEKIDQALVDFGYPVGPIKLLDEVGIDVAAKVGHIVHEAFGDRMTPPDGMEKLTADNRMGRKNGRGFYLYEEGKKAAKKVDPSVYAVLGVEPDRHLSADVIAERCALQMVNEAARCFGEGILRSARDGDIGAIFGLGFPPFRGGPFRYADAIGLKTLVGKLESYRERLGVRFEPAPVLTDMARNGRTFHGDKPAEPGKNR